MSAVDRVLDKCQDVPSEPSWATELGGALRPVTPAKNVELSVISGSMPKDIGGAFLRVGPNPQHWPPKKRTHVFDGDGFLHVVRFADGKAVLHCDFLETPRYEFEKWYGREWFPRIGEFHGKAGLAKILTVVPKKGKLSGIQNDCEMATANTAINFTPDGKLWAHNQSGTPFTFRLDKDGVPSSVGYDSLSGTLKHPVSAHPKIDQRTGEIFFHNTKLMREKYAGRIVDGKLTDFAELKMADGFHHDMFITEKYMVVVDGSMRFTPKGVVQGKPLWMFDEGQKLRFGIYLRSAGKMTPESFFWIEAPIAAEIVHTCYAYDEGDTIVLWSPLGFYEEGKVDGILGGLGSLRMHRLVIDVQKKTVDIQKVPGAELHMTEFPRIRDDCIGGIKVRYGYSGLAEGGTEFNFTGILKWDFDQVKLDKVIQFPEGVIGGEPVFLPTQAKNGSGTDDAGYIGLFLWNQKTSQSTFAVYDAKSFSPTPVVELAVPRRVNVGFHALWITEEQFQQQLESQ